MAGGTGGHVFPALAVARRLQAEGWQVDWLGTHHGLEAGIVSKAGIPLHFLSVTGLRGKGALTLLMAPFRLKWAFFQSWKIIRRLKPTLVLGMGGFVSGPGGLAAWALGRPLVIHEQNAILGLTNRLLARFASQALEGFPGVFPPQVRALYTGNPVREELLKCPAPQQRFADRTGPLRLLILGGSRGAHALNQLCPKAIQMIKTHRPEIWHQAGALQVDITEKAYQEAQVNARVEPFIQDMAAAYQWADLVLCRAGALTIAELSAVGLGSLLVPFPFAVDDHQTHNGRFLEKAGAAILMPQSTLTPEKLKMTLSSFLEDRTQVLKMAEAAYSMAKRDALEQVVLDCKRVIHETER